MVVLCVGMRGSGVIVMVVSGRASGALGRGNLSTHRPRQGALQNTSYTDSVLLVIIHSEHDHLLIVCINARR